MELENEKRASILSDALPYIQQYSNKVVVVKYGGIHAPELITERILKFFGQAA